MIKSIYFAGVSRTNGKLNFRTAQSPARFQQLAKLGDTDVEMVNVNVDSKSAATKELLARNFANGRADIEALLVSIARDDNPFAKPKRSGTVRVKKARLIIGSTSVGADDAPYTPKQAAKIRAEFMKKLAEAYEAN